MGLLVILLVIFVLSDIVDSAYNYTKRYIEDKPPHHAPTPNKPTKSPTPSPTPMPTKPTKSPTSLPTPSPTTEETGGFLIFF